MVKEIKIRDKKIGGDNAVFIISEIGINHNNSLEIAKKMIDSAADAGCDAIKMQAFKAKRMYPISAGKLDWKDDEKEYSYDIFEANKSFEVPDNWWKELSDYAHDKGLVFFSSVCDEKTAVDVNEYIDIMKATSFAITHLPLLKHLASYNKPVMFSTGTATIDEIEEAYNSIKEIPDDIKSMSSNELDKVFMCEISKKPFKMIPQEIRLLKKIQAPLPRKHHDVRFQERIKFRRG